MCRRVILLSLFALCLSLSAWSATAPSPDPAALPQPAVATPPPSGSPAWLLPAPNASPLEKPGSQAPLGALWASCSSACYQVEEQCIADCGGDSSCNIGCSNDYYCCLQTCNPNWPQCA